MTLKRAVARINKRGDDEPCSHHASEAKTGLQHAAVFSNCLPWVMTDCICLYLLFSAWRKSAGSRNVIRPVEETESETDRGGRWQRGRGGLEEWRQYATKCFVPFFPFRCGLNGLICFRALRPLLPVQYSQSIQYSSGVQYNQGIKYSNGI